ncbi:DUF3000 domain-containing protein [Arcanobacterium haemolyticum]|nr:DUF3000 domain-containing protein [Arcanobacterium haemolyticum]
MPHIHAPAPFLEAVESLKGHEFRREVHVTQIPPPKQIAPWAVALQAEINDSPDLDPDTYRGNAKFVLLFDPQGQPAWDGTFRIVTFLSSPVEADMSADPLLGEVTWAWLRGALSDHDAEYRNITGTVTRIFNETFSGSELGAARTELEVRVSWTPTTTDMAAHLQAWASFASTACGLGPEGVRSLRLREI